MSVSQASGFCILLVDKSIGIEDELISEDGSSGYSKLFSHFSNICFANKWVLRDNVARIYVAENDLVGE